MYKNIFLNQYSKFAWIEGYLSTVLKFNCVAKSTKLFHTSTTRQEIRSVRNRKKELESWKSMHMHIQQDQPLIYRINGIDYFLSN